jgi:hypothetical protein
MVEKKVERPIGVDRDGAGFVKGAVLSPLGAKLLPKGAGPLPVGGNPLPKGTNVLPERLQGGTRNETRGSER